MNLSLGRSAKLVEEEVSYVCGSSRNYSGSDVQELFLLRSRSTDGLRITHARDLHGPVHGDSSELLTQTRDGTLEGSLGVRRKR